MRGCWWWWCGGGGGGESGDGSGVLEKVGRIAAVLLVGVGWCGVVLAAIFFLIGFFHYPI